MSLSRPALLQCQNRTQLALLLGITKSSLTYYAYGNGKRYKQFGIAKKNGEVRDISAPVGGLNNIQKKLALLLEEVYNTHPAAHGFIPGKSTLTNATQHLNKKCVLNIDLKDYFASITASRIIGLLKSQYFNLPNEVASTITALCTYNNCLPQGAATSPVLSNMISFRLDRQLTNLCKKERLTYTRYADDIAFSTTRRQFPESLVRLADPENIILGDALLSIVEANLFSINSRKVRLHSGTKAQFVTGVKVNLKPNLSRKYIRQLRSMIHAWERWGPEAAQSKFESEYGAGTRSFINVVYGKLAYLKHIKGREDLVYRRLYNKAVIQEGKYEKVLPVTEIEDLHRRIFVVKSGGQYGTGFILDGKWLITCAHVLESDQVKFFNYDKARFPETYYASSRVKEWISPSKEFDMAALPIDTSIANEANMLKAAPSPNVVETGDECRILGFPQYYIGAVPQIIDVKVVSIESNKYGTYDAHVDRTLVAGNSGGPVLNSRNQVIGIVRRGAPDRDDAIGLGSTFLPIQEMRKCLAGFEKAKS